MARFKPEQSALVEQNPEIEDAPPGVYAMRVSRYKADIETKNGVKDVVNFQCGDCESAMWIAPPDPEKGKKGNMWKYAQLAKAIGDKAVESYRSTDDEGFSEFDPAEWIGYAVGVHVGQYGVEKVVRIVDTENWSHPDDNQMPEDSIGDPQNTDDGRHDDGANDDVPF